MAHGSVASAWPSSRSCIVATELMRYTRVTLKSEPYLRPAPDLGFGANNMRYPASQNLGTGACCTARFGLDSPHAWAKTTHRVMFEVTEPNHLGLVFFTTRGQHGSKCRHDRICCLGLIILCHVCCKVHRSSLDDSLVFGGYQVPARTLANPIAR